MSYKPALFLLIASFLYIDSFSQVGKTWRGIPCSYDTCITMELSNYRQVRQQFISRDSLINSLKKQISIMGSQEVYFDSLINNFQYQISSFNNSLSRKDSLILSLKGDVEMMAEIKTTDPKQWYQRPSTWISGALGVLAGVLLSGI